jgi:ribosome-associated toxin RatA of RatAB toxin-antitoxin module
VIHLEDSVIINEKIRKVYEIAENVENHPKVIPYFKSVRILDQNGNMKLVKRTAEINGKTHSWIGKLIYYKDHVIEYEQIDGPLKGMTGKWIFGNEDNHTKLTITHNIKMEGVLGRLLELVAKNIVGKSAKNTLTSIKNYAENNQQ